MWVQIRPRALSVKVLKVYLLSIPMYSSDTGHWVYSELNYTKYGGNMDLIAYEG